MRTSPDTVGYANQATADSGVPPQDDRPTHPVPSSEESDAHGSPSSLTGHFINQQVQHTFEHGDDFELERPQGHSELGELEIDVRTLTIRALHSGIVVLTEFPRIETILLWGVIRMFNG